MSDDVFEFELVRESRIILRRRVPVRANAQRVPA